MNDVKEELTELLEQKFDCCDITQLVEFMLESGIIPPKRIQYYLIKAEYYKRLKDQTQNCFTVKIDLAEEFDMSVPTIENIIYKYKYVSI